jgi:Tfp pilus assembly protein PilF
LWFQSVLVTLRNLAIQDVLRFKINAKNFNGIYMKIAICLIFSLMSVTSVITSWAAGASSPPDAAALSDTVKKAIDEKNWSKAKQALDAAYRAEPRSADVHSLYGFFYRKQATPDLPKAFDAYRTALKFDPKHKGAHEYIGEAYLMAKQPAEAETHLQQLEAICGNKTCEEYEDLAKALAEYKAKN